MDKSKFDWFAAGLHGWEKNLGKTTIAALRRLKNSDYRQPEAKNRPIERG